MKKILLSFVTGLVLSTAVQAASPGKTAPGFSLNDFSGKETSLKQFEGKIVFVNFWATWCPPCKQEFPELMDLAKNAPDVMVLAINVDSNSKQAQNYLKKLPPMSDNFRVLLDPESKVVAAYNIDAMPSSFIIDTKGIVRFVHTGFNPKDPEIWRIEIDKTKTH